MLKICLYVCAFTLASTTGASETPTSPMAVARFKNPGGLILWLAEHATSCIEKRLQRDSSDRPFAASVEMVHEIKRWAGLIRNSDQEQVKKEAARISEWLLMTRGITIKSTIDKEVPENVYADISTLSLASLSAEGMRITQDFVNALSGIRFNDPITNSETSIETVELKNCAFSDKESFDLSAWSKANRARVFLLDGTKVKHFVGDLRSECLEMFCIKGCGAEGSLSIPFSPNLVRLECQDNSFSWINVLQMKDRAELKLKNNRLTSLPAVVALYPHLGSISSSPLASLGVGEDFTEIIEHTRITAGRLEVGADALFTLKRLYNVPVNRIGPYEYKLSDWGNSEVSELWEFITGNASVIDGKITFEWKSGVRRSNQTEEQALLSIMHLLFDLKLMSFPNCFYKLQSLRSVTVSNSASDNALERALGMPGTIWSFSNCQLTHKTTAEALLAHSAEAKKRIEIDSQCKDWESLAMPTAQQQGKEKGHQPVVRQQPPPEIPPRQKRKHKESTGREQRQQKEEERHHSPPPYQQREEEREHRPTSLPPSYQQREESEHRVDDPPPPYQLRNPQSTVPPLPRQPVKPELSAPSLHQQPQKQQGTSVEAPGSQAKPHSDLEKQQPAADVPEKKEGFFARLLDKLMFWRKKDPANKAPPSKTVKPAVKGKKKESWLKSVFLAPFRLFGFFK